MGRCGVFPGPRPLGWGRVECDRLPFPQPPRGGGGADQTPPSPGRQVAGAAWLPQVGSEAGWWVRREAGGGPGGTGPERLSGGGPGPGRCHPGWRWAGGRAGAPGPGIMAGQPSPHIPPQVSLGGRRRASAAPVSSAHSSYFGSGRLRPELPRIFVVTRMGSGSGGGDLGWRLLPGFLTRVTPFRGRTRGVGEGRTKWVSAPPQRHPRRALGFWALRVLLMRGSGRFHRGLASGCPGLERPGCPLWAARAAPDASVPRPPRGSAERVAARTRGVWAPGEAGRPRSFIVLGPGPGCASGTAEEWGGPRLAP